MYRCSNTNEAWLLTSNFFFLKEKPQELRVLGKGIYSSNGLEDLKKIK
uniref:Uncharacterized protein n=1 Tax=Anguilla anguilla TaxID=7936 RepID=A0A0E9VF23_ANGAN